MRIDVALVLYGRPDHTAAVLDGLIENGVDRVRAFMDYPGGPGVAARQEELLDVIASRSALHVELRRQQRHLGLAASVRAALDATLEQADAAIVLEDDCVVRPGGIEFFRQGLDAYRRDPRVRSVCGYLYPCPFVRHGREPLLLRRFSSWGWATWRDRWRTHDPNLTRVLARLAATGIRLEDVAGDLAVLCSSPKYLANGVDAWSVSWALEHFATGSFAVYPPESMVDNIGFDGTGQHCRRTRAFANAGTGRSCPPSWDWERPVHRPENDDLLRQFMARHGSDIYPDV